MTLVDARGRKYLTAPDRARFLGVAQPVGKNDGLAVFAQDLRVVPVQAVDRHREEPELHGRPLARCVDIRFMLRDRIA